MIRRSLSSFCAGVFALVSLVGCTSSVASPAVPGDAEVTTTSAIVIVERSVDAAAGTRAETSARFVRVAAGVSLRDALRTIGAAVDLPAASTCSGIAALANEGSQAKAATVVELADVGSVSLEANGHETRLVPRQLPDVTDVVSGVVYARAADPILFPTNTRYLVHVAGDADVDPFDVAATAPADPSDVRIAGEDANGVTVGAGAAVDLSWPADGSDDLLYLDVQPAGFRCALSSGATLNDEGAHATIPATLLDEAGSIVVHRVHREALVARGIESGEIRFDFSRSVPYVRH